ncbi:hypothetical protein BEN78_07950 [Xanthomonas citri pv. mangiferaeindicae]|nr:hypothetical protein BEN78_07950 [Xanthomonas citri pv. mangiferaeindicae]
MDWQGNRTNYQYNDRGQLLRVTSGIAPDGNTASQRIITYVWDEPRNRLQQVTYHGASVSQPLSRTRYTYYADNDSAKRGGLTQAIYLDGCSGGACTTSQTRKTTFNYTFHSNRVMKSVTVTPPVTGQARTEEYSAQGDLIRVSNSLGHTVTYSGHNGRGQPGRVVGENGQTVDFAYDARGRLTRRTTYRGDVGNQVESFTYDAMGNVLTSNDGSGATWSYTYNDAGYLTQLQERHGSAVFGTTSYTYDLLGNQTVATVKDAADQLVFKSERQYDAQGFLQAVKGNSGQNFRYTYDGNGNVVSSLDSAGRATTMAYDAAGRRIRVQDALGGVSTTTYDGMNRITRVVDPRGNATTYAYNGFGDVTRQVSPDTGTTTFAYNALGQRTRMTRHDGSWLAYTYDALNRLATTSSGDASMAYGYDWCDNGKGRLCNADSGSGTRHFGYTQEGAVAVTRDVTPNDDDWTHYAYDALGRLGGIRYPGGTSVGYGYNRGRLSVIQATINGTTRTVANQFKYAPTGALTRLVYGNGIVKERNYDLDGRATMIHDTGLLGHTYSYNANNEMVSVQNWSRAQYNQDFGYDALSRLTTINSPVGNQHFTFDANGNRTYHQWLSNETYATQPGTNRLLSSDHHFTYDGRGNRRSKSWSGSTSTYSYDGFNRLSAVSRDVAVTDTNPNYVSTTYPAGTTTYTVNALGQRTAKSGPLGSSRFVYGGRTR